MGKRGRYADCDCRNIFYIGIYSEYQLGVEESELCTTFCGTDSYLAPEIFLKKPYDLTVDLWGYGCFLYELLVGFPPFWSNRKSWEELRERVISVRVRHPQDMPFHARCLIDELLKRRGCDRLGAGAGGWTNVKKHSFFSGVDWAEAAKRELEPALRPLPCGEYFTGNFDIMCVDPTSYFSSEWASKSPSEWAEGWNTKFLGFEYFSDDSAGSINVDDMKEVTE